MGGEADIRSGGIFMRKSITIKSFLMGANKDDKTTLAHLSLAGVQMIDNLVKMLGTILYEPEEVLISKGTESQTIYFINSG